MGPQSADHRVRVPSYGIRDERAPLVGALLSLPLMGMEVPNRIGRQLRVSLYLGTGRIIRADVQGADALEPLRIDLDEFTGHWSLHVGPPTQD
ncbi:hypothetical protein [Streptomyces canus]|uniref:Uncharacterized protein n=1 Tax=Streptomyces canus TaxID=58343 RepID=A0AAW8FXR8_9ACTN|nr:hypothetical protein [Streptomyces canus]MDQ0757534.1 hypothetical protein [Streptomyces canus]MDQ0913478.1 hypothetical protein [Streptomyces canus]MDQ1073770.1 hypothetical protein [Streptomyces canus]